VFHTHKPFFQLFQAKPAWFFRAKRSTRFRPTSEARRRERRPSYLPFTNSIEGDYSREVKENDQMAAKQSHVRALRISPAAGSEFPRKQARRTLAQF
jgi:hypothetical protein